MKKFAYAQVGKLRKFALFMNRFLKEKCLGIIKTFDIRNVIYPLGSVLIQDKSDITKTEKPILRQLK